MHTIAVSNSWAEWETEQTQQSWTEEGEPVLTAFYEVWLGLEDLAPSKGSQDKYESLADD